MGTLGTGVFPVWSGSLSLPYPLSPVLLVLLLEQTSSQCVEWSAWHSSGYKYWGIFPLSGQKSQWCPHQALAAWSGFCSALISFPFALALKQLKHPEWIITVTPRWQLLLSGPSEAPELCSTCWNTHLPPLTALVSDSLGARAHWSVISMKCVAAPAMLPCVLSVCEWSRPLLHLINSLA